ncbi:MAG: bi-domain-containing oxidoreductase [Pirellulaceae bacterium]|nr:bi-domain-containing oxidoreductase [Pirellulaceae bacterium]HJN09205.1 bi-domain-containing oxidoreductase [Pirellulaceae bacterium]
MKQVLQELSNGNLRVADVPAPLAGPHEVLIANRASLLSAGTEKMAMDLARKSLLGKARQRPDQVRRVLEKARNEGLFETMRQVREKLDEPMPMGYSSAGVVLACGREVQEFKPGDRVASNGPHAEVVAVAKHLVARVPDSVPLDQAAFAVLGAIAMQGVRLSEVTLGERVFVIGLGLVGQLAVSLLNAAGCVVIGTDPDAAKCELAKQMGAQFASPELSATHVNEFTGGVGADAVLIAASTKSNGPIELAAHAVKKRGRVVLVGVVGLELDRRPFYFKEAEFVVSCSYGPGRYDPDYEQRGRDYPVSHVRWTEQRNLEAVLQLMAAGKLDVSPLISHRFSITQADQAYALLDQSAEPYLGIVVGYPDSESAPHSRTISLPASQPRTGKLGIGVIGAGNFGKMVLIPTIAALEDVRLVSLCSAKGISAVQVGRKHAFESATSDENEIFSASEVDAVFSITQHHHHAEHVIRAVETGKHCFVEKPLCLTVEELQRIEKALMDQPSGAAKLMVGFNRRFAPAALMVKQHFQGVTAPLTVSVRFNAGAIEKDHWVQDAAEGGGRIIGEACHAIDLATYLIGSPPVRVYAESIGGPHAPQVTDDQCFITLRHADGSLSSVAYLAGGDRASPKERIEVHGGGRTASIDDFRKVETYGGGKKRTKSFRMDKGHQREVTAFIESIRNGQPSPIAWPDIRAVTLASILAVQSIREGVPFDIPLQDGV